MIDKKVLIIGADVGVKKSFVANSGMDVLFIS